MLDRAGKLCSFCRVVEVYGVTIDTVDEDGVEGMFAAGVHEMEFDGCLDEVALRKQF